MFRALITTALLLTAAPALAKDKPACGARVEVNGMQMYYEVSGHGEPLVVLHGAHMNIQNMGEIIAIHDPYACPCPCPYTISCAAVTGGLGVRLAKLRSHSRSACLAV